MDGPARSPATAAAGANRARPSPSASAARSATPTGSSDGLDLDNASAATPIGMSCRVCERLGCPQRAAPPLSRALRIDQNSSTFVPYPVADPHT
ncbi:short-chain fatty acyl-CoA regulator family protein [Streptomyces phaeochromogenes]|uniref:short-chain fatty acyl-CoA regulator family protein n=1 Tax=Streptomyces phaeochromogenes TaxID=1923 RepID=UPI0033C5B4C8